MDDGDDDQGSCLVISGQMLCCDNGFSFPVQEVLCVFLIDSFLILCQLLLTMPQHINKSGRSPENRSEWTCHVSYSDFTLPFNSHATVNVIKTLMSFYHREVDQCVFTEAVILVLISPAAQGDSWVELQRHISARCQVSACCLLHDILLMSDVTVTSHPSPGRDVSSGGHTESARPFERVVMTFFEPVLSLCLHPSQCIYLFIFLNWRKRYESYLPFVIVFFKGALRRFWKEILIGRERSSLTDLLNNQTDLQGQHSFILTLCGFILENGDVDSLNDKLNIIPSYFIQTLGMHN